MSDEDRVEPDELDLGKGVRIRFYSWAPDRELNPQYADMPDIERVGGIVSHPLPQGGRCEGSVIFDRPGIEGLFEGQDRWKVVSEDPLTLEPSIRCGGCNAHGWIRKGKWVDA